MNEPTIWYEADEGEVHDLFFSWLRSLEEDQISIHEMNLLYAKLYSNRELQAIDWGRWSFERAQHRPLSATSDNIIQSVCTTATSMIAKNRPKGTPIVRGGSFKLAREAKKLDRYLFGLALSQNFYREAPRVFNDATWAGTGFLRVDLDHLHKCIVTERIMPDEIVVDQQECLSSMQPSTMVHRRLMSQQRVLELWGKGRSKKAEDVRLAVQKVRENGYEYTSYLSLPPRMMIVAEAWHLESFPGAGDGRHIIATPGATLLDEPYTRKRFPIIPFRWEEPLSGFYGQGAAELLMPAQLRVNELNDVIKRSQDLHSRPRIFMDAGSSFIKQTLDNALGRIYQYRGRMPESQVWQAVSRELYEERQRQIESAYNFIGISPMMAQNKLPTQTRLDSSPALREATVMGNERFARHYQRYDDFALEYWDHLRELSVMAHKLGWFSSVTYREGDVLDRVDFKTIEMGQDDYILSVEASSIENMTPAARKDLVRDYLANGVIQQEDVPDLVGQNDLEKEFDLESARKRNIDQTITKLAEGELPMPDPLQDLVYGIPRVHAWALHIQDLDDTPTEVIENTRIWLALADSIMARAEESQAQEATNQQAAAAAAMPEGPPGAAAIPPQPMGPGANTPPGAAGPGLA